MIIDINNQYKRNINKCLKLGGKSILEIGCGKGTLTKHLIAQNEVTAIDPETKNIQFVRAKYPSIRAEVGFAEDLKFEDKSFDIVIYCLSFHHVGNMKKALKEANRVLKDGGFICFIELTNEGTYLQCEMLFFDETKEK